MKRLVLVLLALLFAATVYAEDRLSLSGEMRVRAWAKSDYDFDSDTDSSGMEGDWFDQRFRLATKIQVADGITANLRCDFTDGTWGDSTFTGNRPTPGSGDDIEVDRAYLQIDKEMYTLTAGLMYQSLGNAIVYDSNTRGMALALKLPVTVTLVYSQIDEGNAIDSTFNTTGTAVAGNTTRNNDNRAYAINLGYAGDNYSLAGYFALAQVGTFGAINQDIEANVFGINGAYTYDIYKFKGELSIFGGDDGATTGTVTDFTGTQFYGNVEAALNDEFTVGLDLIYAQGAGENEIQISAVDMVRDTNLTNFGDFSVLDRGAFNTDIFAGHQEFDIALLNTAYDTNTSATGVTGTGSGSVGFGLYADYKAQSDLLLQLGVAYLTPEEDNNTCLDSATFFNLSATYDLAENTTLAAGFQHVAVDVDKDKNTAAPDDDASTLACRLQLTF